MTKFQTPNNNQYPIINNQTIGLIIGKLVIGIYLVLGAWCLVIPNAYASSLKGVGFLPRNFPYQKGEDFLDFMDKAKQAGQMVAVYGDWYNLKNKKNGPPVVFTELGKRYGYTPLIGLQFFNNGSPKREALRNIKKFSNEYKKLTLEFVKKYQPLYLAIGLEINLYYEKNPDDFENFVTLYRELYDEIKKISPQTKVFTIFQLERLKGLSGLFGEAGKPTWYLLHKFEGKLDLVGITTYPDLIYKDPKEIPQDYYEEIKTYTDRPIAFTEIAWPSEMDIAGYSSSEEKQTQFVKIFFDLTKTLDKEIVIWTILHDNPGSPAPFKGLGLRKNNGEPKLAWDTWKKEN